MNDCLSKPLLFTGFGRDACGAPVGVTTRLLTRCAALACLGDTSVCQCCFKTHDSCSRLSSIGSKDGTQHRAEGNIGSDWVPGRAVAVCPSRLGSGLYGSARIHGRRCIGSRSQLHRFPVRSRAFGPIHSHRRLATLGRRWQDRTLTHHAGNRSWR